MSAKPSPTPTVVFTGLVPVTQFADERPLAWKLGGRDKPGQDEEEE